jgi:hypothetical protein
MKKLLVIKAILLVVALCLISLFASCSPEEIPTPTPQEQAKKLEVIIEGLSPECFIKGLNSPMIYLTQPYITRNVNKGDVITAIGYSYSIDNSNNYGAPNVNVIGNITFKINGEVVKSGIGNLSYQVP